MDIKSFFKGFVTFEGKAGRGEFSLYLLISLAVFILFRSLVVERVDAFLLTLFVPVKEWFFGIVLLVIIAPAIRRLRDIQPLNSKTLAGNIFVLTAILVMIGFPLLVIITLGFAFIILLEPWFYLNFAVSCFIIFLMARKGAEDKRSVWPILIICGIVGIVLLAEALLMGPSETQLLPNNEESISDTDALLVTSDFDSSDALLQPDADMPYNAYITLYQAGAFEKAAEVLLQELSNTEEPLRYEKEAELRVRLAVTYHNMGNQAQCLEALKPYERQLKKIKPEDPDESLLDELLSRRELMRWVKKTRKLCSCPNSDPTGCFQLEPSFISDKDAPTAFVKYQKACEEKSGFACFGAGYLCEDMKDCREDDYFSRSCELHYPRGCTRLGWFYEEEEPAKAESYFKKACQMESADGCRSLASFYFFSTIPEHKKKSRKLLHKACSMGSTNACYNKWLWFHKEPAELAE